MARRELSLSSKAAHAVQEGRVSQIPARVYEIKAGTTRGDDHLVIILNNGQAYCDCKAAQHGQGCHHTTAAQVVDHRNNRDRLSRRRENRNV